MYQPPPKLAQPRKKPDVIGLLIIAALIFLALFVFGWPMFGDQISNQLSLWWDSMAPSCTIGVTGTEMTFTITAWSSKDDCQKIVTGQENFLPYRWKPNHVYLTQEPSSTVMCTGGLYGRRIVVRDGADVKIAGRLQCRDFGLDR